MSSLHKSCVKVYPKKARKLIGNQQGKKKRWFEKGVRDQGLGWIMSARRRVYSARWSAGMVQSLSVRMKTRRFLAFSGEPRDCQ